MIQNLKKILTNPQVFPVELVMSSGHTLRIKHPDYVFVSEIKGGLLLLPQTDQDEHGFEWIDFSHVTHVRGRQKRGFWNYFFSSKE